MLIVTPPWLRQVAADAAKLLADTKAAAAKQLGETKQAHEDAFAESKAAAEAAAKAAAEKHAAVAHALNTTLSEERAAFHAEKTHLTETLAQCAPAPHPARRGSPRKMSQFGVRTERASTRSRLAIRAARLNPNAKPN
eukprot:9483616-Pyramimonas_sp.AAC.1